jgi:hypothetical protein
VIAMIYRRRPVLRAAAVAGAGYHLGRRSAARSAARGRARCDARLRTSSVLDRLARLDGLHRRGALTDVEFAAAKARLLRC